MAVVEVVVGEHEAGADAVRGVDAADDAGVVDDRDEVTDAVVGTPAEERGVGPGVVPVLGVQARDQLRHPRGAAGELEDRDVVGVDPALDRLDASTGLGGVDVGGAGRSPRTRTWRIVGCSRRLLVGELDEVDAPRARLHEVRPRADRPADVRDLVAAVRGEGRDRHQPGLEQRVPGHDGLEPVRDLDDARGRPGAGRGRRGRRRCGRCGRRARRRSAVPRPSPRRRCRGGRPRRRGTRRRPSGSPRDRRRGRWRRPRRGSTAAWPSSASVLGDARPGAPPGAPGRPRGRRPGRRAARRAPRRRRARPSGGGDARRPRAG